MHAPGDLKREFWFFSEIIPCSIYSVILAYHVLISITTPSAKRSCDNNSWKQGNYPGQHNEQGQVQFYSSHRPIPTDDEEKEDIQ